MKKLIIAIFIISALSAVSLVTMKPVCAGQAITPEGIVKLTNKYRSTPLVLDAKLSEVAQRRADDMATKHYFSHVSPEGLRAWDFMKRYNYHYLCAGENLAVGYKSDKSVVAAWIASPSHKDNIVDPKFTNIGIGISSDGKNVYVVQLFSKPQ